MKNEILEGVRLDKSKFSIGTLADDFSEREYWLSRPVVERLKQIEILRIINYGDGATARLQRFFEIAQLASE